MLRRHTRRPKVMCKLHRSSMSSIVNETHNDDREARTQPEELILAPIICVPRQCRHSGLRSFRVFYSRLCATLNIAETPVSGSSKQERADGLKFR